MNHMLQIIKSVTLGAVIILAAAGIYASSTDKVTMEQFALYLEEGKRLYDAGDYTKALEKFTEAGTIDPWDEEVTRLIEMSLAKLKEIDKLLYEGFRLLEKSKPDEASQIFMKVKNEIGADDEHLLSLAEEGLQRAEEQKRETYRERIEGSGTEYLDPGRIGRIAVLQERIRQEEFEREVEATREHARALFEQEAYEESKEKWERLIGLVPGDEEAAVYLTKIETELEAQRKFLQLAESTFQQGMSLYSLGEYEESRERFESAVVMGFRMEDARVYIERIEDLLLERKRREEERQKSIAILRDKSKRLFDEWEYVGSRTGWEQLLGIVPGDGEALMYISKIDFKVREKQRLLELAESYFESGTRLYREQRYEVAIDQFENAIAMDYRAIESRRYIAEIAKRVSEREREEQQKRTEQVALLLREGIKYYNLNDFKRSLSVLNEGLKLDPENSQIREYIVRDIIALKRQEEASVSDTSPFYSLVENLNRLGTQAYNNGDYTDAVKHFEQILLIFPFDERARLKLARALSKTDPSLVRDILENMYSEAGELIEGGSAREAVVKLKLVLEVDPGFEKAIIKLAQLTRKQEEKKKVVTKQDQERARELYIYGLGLYRSEKLEESVKTWQQAVELDPEFVEARVFLARAETQLRNLERMEAQEDETSGGYGEDLRIRIKRHYLDGIHLFMEGLYAEAITEWEEVLNIDPEHESAKLNIERAKQRLGFEAGRENI